MDLNLDKSIVGSYHSQSQIARILTEGWVGKNMFCPRCGSLHISHFENNRPVADFFCPTCNNEYELKSKNGTIRHKVADGAYEAMIKRITGNQNPDFFFMSYSMADGKVNDFILIPKYFFVPDIIEKRKPLAETARRAGWVGCNIRMDKIPEQCKIPIVSNGKVSDVDSVIKQANKSSRLEIKNIGSRGWLMDILNCVNRISEPIFTLDAMYAFEKELQIKHPQNNHIKPKIRQQLQFLRDKGFVEFLVDGHYRKML